MTTAVLPSGAAVPAGLPVHLTRFIGRDHELEELAQLVASSRLLTLTGAGGSGKTRLAGEVATRAVAAFDRLAWVDLAFIADPDLIAQQIAVRLNVTEVVGVPQMDVLIDAICGERTLLVLDNCEHLVAACAALTEALLQGCPRLHVIATSREALGVAGETAWLVPPMAGAEAGQLFVERAQAALPSFAVTPANAAAVAEICRRLDGIPLAIELAAARVRVLTPAQIAERLDDAFRLLATGSRTALPRHRTLRATMDWSFALLAAREQVLLRRLAVFAGSFSLDAAEAVCAGEALEAEDVLDGVSALVDKSLVVMDPGDGTARYRLLETVRQYGLERLIEAGERETLSRRHAEHFLDVIERAAPNLVGGSNVPGLVESLTADQDNMRVATGWAVADSTRAEMALRFVGAMYWFWYATSRFREARQLTDRALALDAPALPTHRAHALISSALTGLAQGDYPLACRDFDAALALLRDGGDGGDGRTVGAALSKYGAARLLGGEVDAAIVLLDEALELTRDFPPDDIAAIFARFWRGWAAYRQGDRDLAYRLVEHNVRVGRRYNLPVTLAHALATMARTQAGRGDIDGACATAAESLERELAIGDGWGMALALDVVAIVAAERGRHEDAVRLLGGIEAHRERISVALPDLAPAERERLLATLRTSLGAQFDELFAEGRALSSHEAVALAQAEVARHTMEHRVVSPSEVRVDTPRDPTPAAAGRPMLRILALGPLQVFAGDRLVEPGAWGSARPRELLVYLLMHPEGRTKEQVGLAFWPDASAAQLRNNFHVTLHRLRKALGSADVVTLASERYRVDPALVQSFDVLEFERSLVEARRALKAGRDGATARLEEALALFRGDFLDGEPVGDWHLEHRDRLQRLYADALMELGSRLVAEERYAKGVEVYRRVLARDELHEEALQTLVRCHAALGERAQAVRVYRRFAERLRAELDAEPDAETTRLVERLQR